MRFSGLALALASALTAGAAWAAEPVVFSPDMDELAIQEALIVSDPGTVFVFEEGTYTLTLGLSCDLDGAVIRGRGIDKTVLDFSGQEGGGQGIYITADNVTLEDMTLRDAKGNAHKSNAANQHVIRRVKAEWTGGPKPTNGAYGFYPVSSKNVLIEECVAIGASDAGIYVGQTENVIVRKSRAEYNVAGIEIENCHGADVYDNVATNNTGGILVFDLPGLPMQKGRDVRVFRNKCFDNDTPNFAPPGNIVGNVAQGTGIMVMANSNVEVFDNDVRDHRTFNLVVCSYLGLDIPIKDANYYPYPERIYIAGNTFGPGGHDPQGAMGTLLGAAVGKPVPDIVWDGFVNREKIASGALTDTAGIVIGANSKEGGEVSFINLDAENSLKDPLNAKFKRDLAAHRGEFARLPGVTLPGGMG